jgi:hypothetical protein
MGHLPAGFKSVVHNCGERMKSEWVKVYSANELVFRPMYSMTQKNTEHLPLHLANITHKAWHTM